MAGNNPICHADNQVSVLTLDGVVPNSFDSHRINVFGDETFCWDQVSDDRHATVSIDVVDEDGKIVLSMSRSLPDFDVVRKLAVRALKTRNLILKYLGKYHTSFNSVGVTCLPMNSMEWKRMGFCPKKFMLPICPGCP